MKLLGSALALCLASTLLHAQTSPQPVSHVEMRQGQEQPPHPDGAMDDMHKDKPPVPPSRFLNVTYAGRTITLKLEDLAAMPQVTVHVHNAHRNTDEDYSGPLVADVLAKAGLVASKVTEPLILHSSLLAGATDHYFVVFSMAEVEPSFSRGQVIVAIMKSGLPDKEGGNIQLINTDGTKPARWVHGLSDLNVITLMQNR